MSVEGEKPVPVAMSRPLEELLQHAQADLDMLAVLLFGSVARGEHTSTSDVDVCLVLQARQYSPLARIIHESQTRPWDSLHNVL